MAIKQHSWSEKEVALLKELYPIIRVKDLASYFPHRTKSTIVAKALSLGLPSAKLWSEKDNKLLRRHFRNTTKETLTTLFPRRSWSGILAQGERLGLRRERNHPRKHVDENYFEKWSPNMAYLLGYILADGCIIEGTYKGYSGALKFGVQKSDIDILEKIKQELKSEHTISVTGNAAHLCITSQKIVDDLKKRSIAYRKSLREDMPRVPRPYLRDFIRGLIDGDGEISINEKDYPTLRLCGGETVMTFVRKYFLSRLHAYSTIGKRSKYKDSNYLYSIAYRGNPAKTIIEYLYQDADLYLDRKFRLAQCCINLQINHRKDYTQKEEQLLKQFYRSHPKEEMLSLLTNRSWSSIQKRARILGLYKYSKKK